MKKFVMYNNNNKKQCGYTVLTMDNFSGHVNEDLSKLCKDNKIMIKTFPPHSSHFTQTCNLGVFATFKFLENSQEIKNVIMENKMSHTVPENERMKHLEKYVTVHNNFIVSLKDSLTDERRIMTILDAWNKAYPFSNI